MLLGLDWIKSVKISELISITLVGVSVSWLAFNGLRIRISSNIPFLSLLEDEKGGSCVLLHISPVANMQGSFLYFTIDLISGSLVLFEVGWQWVYSRAFRVVKIFEKKALKIRTV